MPADEKKPPEPRPGLIGGIQRFSTSDGPGIRTTVFLKGCPLACQWCHNPELIARGQQLMRTDTKCIGCRECLEACSKGAVCMDKDGFFIDRDLCDNCMDCVDVCMAEALRPVGEFMTVEQVMAVVGRDTGYYEKSGGGLTISGGELLSQPDFTRALITAARAEHISVALDTSGCGSGKVLAQMAGYADHILFDVKGITPEVHREYTGLDNGLILDNLKRLAADPRINPKITIRMPLIRGVNDGQHIITAACRFFTAHKLKSVTLLPYHELGRNKSHGLGKQAKTFSAPDHDRLLQIKTEFESAGLTVEILGEDIQ